MKNKYLLFIGIVSIIFGVIFKISLSQSTLSTAFFIFGGLSKITYIVSNIIFGIYKPGKELSLLYIGLSVFLIALTFKSNIQYHFLYYGIYLGIVLKTSFIMLFIRKTRQLKTVQQ